jgi:hypothetical protein
LRENRRLTVTSTAEQENIDRETEILTWGRRVQKWFQRSSLKNTVCEGVFS